MGSSLKVDPLDLHMSSDHMDVHHADLTAAHTAADRAQVATIALAAGGALLAGGAAVWWLGAKTEASPRVALQIVPVGPAAQLGASFSSSF